MKLSEFNATLAPKVPATVAQTLNGAGELIDGINVVNTNYDPTTYTITVGTVTADIVYSITVNGLIYDMTSDSDDTEATIMDELFQCEYDGLTRSAGVYTTKVDNTITIVTEYPVSVSAELTMVKSGGSGRTSLTFNPEAVDITVVVNSGSTSLPAYITNTPYTVEGEYVGYTSTTYVLPFGVTRMIKVGNDWRIQK